MTCIEVQKRMAPFIQEEMDKKTLEKFLGHIRTCESCREDLEVYYTLYTGLKLLDEDKNKSVNYQLKFEKKLKRAEEVVRRGKRMNLYKKIAVFLFLIFIGFFI